ncbi:MAG: DNA-3-methyladenine glycosylase [Moraxellaceae bacterium]|jgi:DNA-3-methyladenine glycosylase|nr:DNA-3-methyladenine glycosylase [Moraxellaceae bacterium]
MRRKALPTTFYRRDTTTVARELLGMRLCRQLPDGDVQSGIIVETEAYLGREDPACHTYGGRHTPRTATMYAAGGVAYVYLIYGMYYCLNAVTRDAGEPEAVLIRALAPEQGMAQWQAAYPRLKPHQWLSGPGRLCRALQIDKSLDGLSLRSEALWIEKGERVAGEDIVSAPRIGVDYAGAAAQWPLRFYVHQHPAVSRR